MLFSLIRVMSKIKNVFSILLLMIVCVPFGWANEPIAELIWVSSETTADGIEHHIMLSELDVNTDTNARVWSQPVSIYQSVNLLTGPTMVTQKLLSSAKSRKTLIWSEHERLKSVLKIMHKSQASDKWEADTTLTRFGKDNLGPAAIVDMNNVMWVFWAATKEDLSDIFYIRSQGLGWTQAKQFNTKNQVPDYQPQLSNTLKGDIEVSWYSYSFLLTDYIRAKQLIQLAPKPQLSYKANILETELTKADVPTPSFLPLNAAVVLHFPNNKLTQSYYLQDD